jgi:hypothetical protein
MANSSAVADRIARFYGREAVIVPPPVAVDDFAVDVPRDPEAFLWVHRLVAYKRPLEVAEAFRGLPDLRLTMVGLGPLEAELRATAPPNVEVLGWVPRDRLAALFAGAGRPGADPRRRAPARRAQLGRGGLERLRPALLGSPFPRAALGYAARAWSALIAERRRRSTDFGSPWPARWFGAMVIHPRCSPLVRQPTDARPQRPLRRPESLSVSVVRARTR